MTTSPRRQLTSPFADFLAKESAGALLIAGAVVAALVWRNSGSGSAYVELVSGWSVGMDLQHWVDDGLMALFFLVAGLEIKRELVEGELSTPRQAALPAVAAFGGMVAPAVVHLAITAGTPHTEGWAIPIATDIALAVGVVSALGDRVPRPAKVFLLALAIVDDLGAVIVIAVGFNTGIRWLYLAGVVGCALAVWALGRARPDLTVVFVAIGILMWWLMHESGVHATLAGVVMGLLTPTSRIERTEHALHPWTSSLVVPIFAFVNAGVLVTGEAVSGALGSRGGLGIVLGLVLGKPLGIGLAVLIATRAGLGAPGLDGRTLAGVGALAGVGFTMSIFFAELALTDPAAQQAAKLAIMVGSLVATAAGTAILGRSR